MKAGCIGTQPPSVYLAWHRWAEEHYKAGIRQKRCPQCQLWRFPQELSEVDFVSSATTTKHGTEKAAIHGKICNDCAKTSPQTI